MIISNVVKQIIMNYKIFGVLILLVLTYCCKDNKNDPAKNNTTGRVIDRSYEFGDGVIPRNVLESYLSRAITQGEFCHPTNDAEFKENLRMIQNIGAKFIGRAAFEWTPYTGNEAHFATVEARAKQAHQADPDFLLQCCIFEAIFKSDNTLAPGLGVDLIPVPEWVFKEFNLPVEARNFNYEAMLFDNGKYHKQWANTGAVPDITKLETQLYFYYRAVRYVDAGYEAIHWGQVMVMGTYDTNFTNWFSLLERVRKYGLEHARRGMVICDAHAYYGIVSDDGHLLLDFHSFPQRPQEICGTPYNAILRIGYIDAIYKLSKGGITPSGWECKSLPYLVEFDNSGAYNPGVCGGPNKHWPWGWDEIGWFAHCNESYRNYWLEYAWAWIEKNDPVGFLQMPGQIPISSDPILVNGKTLYFYHMNTKSDADPYGFGQEETVKKIWQDSE